MARFTIETTYRVPIYRQRTYDDFMAYTYSRMRASKVSCGLDYEAEAPMALRKREAGLTHLEILPAALRGLKETFERERREAADMWRSQRDARKAGVAR